MEVIVYLSNVKIQQNNEQNTPVIIPGMKNTLSRSKRRFAIGWLIPMIAYYTFWSIVPIVAVLVLSFTDWDGRLFEEIGWVGFKHYQTFFTNSKYILIFLQSFLMGIIIFAVTLVFSFIIAYFINLPIRGKTIYRTVWYIPCVVSMAVVSELVSNLLDPGNGLLNLLLMQTGKEPVMWQLSPFWMWFWICTVSVWKGLGGTIILFLAGMAGIPKELYEAARVDGAGNWKMLLHITIPGLKQMSAFIIITSLMGVFNMFEQVQLISQGGPDGSTMVIMYQIYNEAFENFNVGMSSMLSVVVMILVSLITMLNIKLTRISI